MQNNPRLYAVINQLLQDPARITAVHLVVGELVDVSDEQIKSQWSEAPFAQVKLIIRRVLAEQQCMTCFEKYHPTRAEVSCPNCGSVGAKIISGEEFYLESVDRENE